MPLGAYGDLAIAELVFWAPALVLSVYVTFKHGFNRHTGWIFLILIALARLIGASCTIAEEQQSTPNSSLIAAAAITGSIGVSFLIQAVLGMITRVIEGTPQILEIPTRAARWLHILLLVGIIVGIVGGVDLANGGGDVHTGLSLLKASVILFLVALVLVGIAVAITLMRLSMVPSGEKRIVYACLVCWPFIFVRLLYSILDVFINDSVFSYFSGSVWARAFMATAEEFIVAAIIIATGIAADKVQPGLPQGQADYEMGQRNAQYPAPGNVSGNAPQQEYGHIKTTR